MMHTSQRGRVGRGLTRRAGLLGAVALTASAMLLTACSSSSATAAPSEGAAGTPRLQLLLREHRRRAEC